MTTLEFINVICPEHGRTSCSDDNLSNGFVIEEYTKDILPDYRIRCTRCALLQIERGEIELTEQNLEIIQDKLNLF